MASQQNFHRAIKRPLLLKFLYLPAAGDEGHAWFPALIAPALRPRAAGLGLLIQKFASSRPEIEGASV